MTEVGRDIWVHLVQPLFQQGHPQKSTLDHVKMSMSVKILLMRKVKIVTETDLHCVLQTKESEGKAVDENYFTQMIRRRYFLT